MTSSVTRRSAGIPIIIHAVLVSEKKMKKVSKAGGKNISILHLSCRTSDLQFDVCFKHMYLSFKSVYNKEHKEVNMTYKVPYITVKMIFTQSKS